MQATTRLPQRIVTVILAVLVAISVLAPTAGASAVTQEDWRQQTMSDIAGLIPTGNDDADKKLNEAVKKLSESLNSKYWADASTPSKDGDEIFKKDEEAVKKLREAAKKLREKGPGDTAVIELMNRLVDNSAALAQAAIDEAVAAGGKSSDIEKAEEKMAKAYSELADGKPEDAVEQFKKAWEEAFDAWKDAVKSSSSGSSDGGKYSVYTFWFIDLTNPGAAPFAETGTNKYGTPGYTGAGNEGYLQVGDEWMQLHVSCSDAFTGGTGDKSDPTDASKYRVVNYVISKYDNGELNKTCNLVGVPDVASIDLGIVHDGGYGEMEVVFTVTNSGSVDLSNIQLVDVTNGGDTSSCAFGTLIPGAFATCRVPVEYRGGLITTTATAQASYTGGQVSVSQTASFDDTP